MKRIKLLSYVLATSLIALMASCADSVNTGKALDYNSVEVNNRAFFVQQDSQLDLSSFTKSERDLYTDYLNGQKNLKPRKVYSGSTSDFAPKPNTDVSKSVPDTTPHLNLVKNKILKQIEMGDTPFPSQKYPERKFSIKQQSASRLHWGSGIETIANPVDNQWGIYTGHSVNQSQSFPDEDTLLYSPTSMPPNNTPLEVTTVYYRPPSSSATSRQVGIWDHTGEYKNPSGSGNWLSLKSMTPGGEFDSKYLASFSDGTFYFLQILKTSSTQDEFTVQLYNHQTGLWENQSGPAVNLPAVFNNRTNQTAYGFGWAFHEPKFDDKCPEFNDIKLAANGLRVWDGDRWYDNSIAENGFPIDTDPGYVCPNWNLNMTANYYKWNVTVD
jgi:hypothetical protein